MKRKTSIAILGGLGIFASALLLSSCTASFCSVTDTARIMYTYDRGVTAYYDGNDVNKPEDAKKIDGLNNVYYTVSFENSTFLEKTIIPSCKTNGIMLPAIGYFEEFDSIARDLAIETAMKNTDFVNHLNISDKSEINYEKLIDILDLPASKKDGVSSKASIPGFGYTRFSKVGETDKNNRFSNYDEINKKIQEKVDADTEKTLKYSAPTADFTKVYKNALDQKTTNYRSCLTTTNGYYGNYGADSTEHIYMDEKTWGYAWSKGFFEGLLVYPIAYMADFFTLSFAGGSEATLAAGWPQLLSIVLVTIIVRTILLLITWPSTASQAKMTELQPELRKLQQKYPNANTNQYEKQRLAQEQMALYKKYKVKPMLQFVALIIQFPFFICVWGALSGSAALSTGAFLNLNLSSTVLVALQNTSQLPGNGTGWWTALILFILMAVAQFFAIKVPQWVQKKNESKVKKMNASNYADSTQKNMKIFQYVMLAFIIIMGLMVPSAMGVYWLIGAFFSMAQSTLLPIIYRKLNKSKKEKGKIKK